MTERIALGMLLTRMREQRDLRAAQALLDYVSRRPKPMANGMPAGLGTTADVVEAANALLRAVAAGEVTPTEAQRTVAVVELARRALETQDLEKRIEALEARAKE